MFAGIEMARPLPRFASIALTTSSHGPAFRDDTTTFAPCSAMRSTMARPMPRDEPVTTATLPVRLNSVRASSRILLLDFAADLGRKALESKRAPVWPGQTFPCYASRKHEREGSDHGGHQFSNRSQPRRRHRSADREFAAGERALG